MSGTTSKGEPLAVAMLTDDQARARRRAKELNERRRSDAFKWEVRKLPDGRVEVVAVTTRQLRLPSELMGWDPQRTGSHALTAGKPPASGEEEGQDPPPAGGAEDEQDDPEAVIADLEAQIKGEQAKRKREQPSTVLELCTPRVRNGFADEVIPGVVPTAAAGGRSELPTAAAGGDPEAPTTGDAVGPER